VPAPSGASAYVALVIEKAAPEVAPDFAHGFAAFASMAAIPGWREAAAAHLEWGLPRKRIELETVEAAGIEIERLAADVAAFEVQIAQRVFAANRVAAFARNIAPGFELDSAQGSDWVAADKSAVLGLGLGADLEGLGKGPEPERFVRLFLESKARRLDLNGLARS